MENEVLTREEVLKKRELLCRIADFGFTGEGYVRLEDGWLSIAGALPGELVRVKVQENQRKGARRIYADLLEVIEKSSSRRDPACVYDALCRGCQLRHLTIDAEFRFKVRTVSEVIERYAGIGIEAQPTVEVISPQPIARSDAFRIRSSLRYRRQNGTFELGLFSHGAEHLIPMVKCPALTQAVQRMIGLVEESLRELPNIPFDAALYQELRSHAEDLRISPGLVQISLAAPTHGVGLVDIQLTDVEDLDELQNALKEEPYRGWINNLRKILPSGVGLSVQSNNHRIHLSGPERIRVPLGSWRMEVGFDDWFHANLEPAERIYEELKNWLSLRKEDRVLDVGCGTGTIALMLSPSVREVVGIDVNRSSIEAAQINALSHERQNATFLTGGWEKALRKLVIQQEQFDVATINPMREPLGRRPLSFLAATGVREILYLGPSPESASRDLAELLDLGFELKRLGAANLHPATYHTFLMALLQRK